MHEKPGEALLLQVRAAFTLQRSSLRQWCRQNGVLSSNARACLIGDWNGPAGQRMRRRICAAAGLE